MCKECAKRCEKYACVSSCTFFQLRMNPPWRRKMIHGNHDLMLLVFLCSRVMSRCSLPELLWPFMWPWAFGPPEARSLGRGFLSWVALKFVIWHEGLCWYVIACDCL